jgi:hypothetical protein
MERDTERFQHRGVGVAQGVWNGVQKRRRPGDVVSQAAIVLAVAGETDCWTEVAIAFHALFAHSTRPCGVEGYPSPIVQPTLDDSSELVPEYERMQELGIPDTSFGEPVEVRSAQPYGGHPDEALALSRGWPVLLSSPDVPHCVQAGHLHELSTTPRRQMLGSG